MHIFKANLSDIARITPLFIDYRLFYKMPAQPEIAQKFLFDRCEQGQSTLFAAENEQGELLGFAHLYPLFCSLEMKPIWLLYDLFVSPLARKQGIGKALLEKADKHGRDTGAAFIMLSTATDNITAQSLYETHGYHRDTDFYSYNHLL
ncbi:MAG: GNAT family N-acetyltransferase [Aeromonas sp.]